MIPGRITHLAAAGVPRIRLVGSSSAANSFTTSLPVSQPSGARAGDLGLLMHTHNTGVPAGWTTIASTVGALAYKIYDGTETTITTSTGSNTQMANLLTVFRGVHNTSPIDAQSSVRNVTSGSSFPSNAATSVHADTVLLSCCREFTSSGSSVLTVPSGMNLIRQVSPSFTTFGMAYVAGPVAGGSSGTPSWAGSIATFDATVVNVLLRSATT